MKKYLPIFLFFSVCMNIHSLTGAQNVGIGTSTPHVSALLEIGGLNKGFLIPRMSTSQRNGIASPALGLQIFNLDESSINIFDGVQWVTLSANDITKWSNLGNANTNPLNNFIGTTDAKDFVVRSNNLEGLRLKSLSPVVQGVINPTDVLLLTNPGTTNNKWPLSASFQLGSYEAGINANTQMDIALGNNATPTPDVKVMSLLGNGNVSIAGQGKFGTYLKIGTDVNEGYFQNSQDGAYRALATGGDQGYYFQDAGGEYTTMYIGLNGAYKGKVGINTWGPDNALTVVGDGDFTG